MVKMLESTLALSQQLAVIEVSNLIIHNAAQSLQC